LDVARERRIGVLISLVILCGLIALMWLGRLQGPDNWFYGLCFRLRGDLPACERIALVGIDADSVAERGPWPWSFEDHAHILRTLDAAGAATVVFDMPDLAQVGEQPAAGADQAILAEALSAARCKTVLPFVIESGTDPQAEQTAERLKDAAVGFGELPRPTLHQPGRLALPHDNLHMAADGIGCTNMWVDIDGTVRDVPLMVSYQGRLFPSLALEAFRRFAPDADGPLVIERAALSSGPYRVPMLWTGEMRVNYYGRYRHYETVSCRRLFSESPEDLERLFEGRLVFVGPVYGTSAPTYNTPNDARLLGIEINANAAANLIEAQTIRQVPDWAVILAMALLSMLLCLTLPNAGVFRGTVIVIAVLLGVGGLMFWRFTHSVWFPMGGPMLCVALIGLAMVARAAAISDRLHSEASIRLQSRLQAITGVGRLIDSSLERRELLDATMRWVEAELEVEAASLLLLDPDTQRLRFEVALGEKGDQIKDFTVALGQGIAGTVAQTAEPMVINDVARDPRHARDLAKAVDYPVHNLLCVPMLLRGKVIGVIEVMNKRGRLPFTEYDTALLTVIAQQAGLFLENARLYAILQSRVDYANAELRAANLELASEKAKVETMVQEMVDGVVSTDEADRIVLINDAAERMLGLSAENVLGEPALATVRQPDLVRLWAMPLSPHGGTYTEEVEFDGDRPVSLQVTIALIGGGDEIGGKCMILTDITEFKIIDQMKSDLIAFVSHELKTPLTNIGLYTELLQSRLEPDEDQNLDITRVIMRQTLRMRHMVEDFLNISRIDADRGLSMNFTRLENVAAIINDIVEIEGHGRDTHFFELSLPDPVPDLWADRAKLEEVFANLIGNAMKFSPRGGRIRVRGELHGPLLRFSISDEGIGMSKADQARLFRRFERVGTSGSSIPGTGLGLFICKHLIEAHGGTIWAESTEGEGSTFHFTVPLYDGQDQEAQDVGPRQN